MLTRRFSANLAVAFCLTSNGAYADITPIQAAFGNVFPTLTDQSLSVGQGSSSAQSYVAFDLLTESNVKVGALGLGAGSQGSFYSLTSSRLVTRDGSNVAFGTDSFTTNPFPQRIESLTEASRLPAGSYAIEVSGVGNRVLCTPYCGDTEDFVVHLQVTPSQGTSDNIAATPVTSVQGHFGNIFPTNEQSLAVGRSASGGPWYVSFDLLADANVNLGARGLGPGSQGSYFDLTSIRVLDDQGRNIKFGTDTFNQNPFSDPIDALIEIPALRAGRYFAEWSGYGNRVLCTPYCGDTEDTLFRLQVNAVPEPATYCLMLAGLGLVVLLGRGKRAALQRQSPE